MKRLMVFILIALCGGATAATNFDGNGVWYAVENTAITAGNTVNFGPQNVTQRANEINLLAYGATSGDSLKLTITIYGMMTYATVDTIHAVQLKTTTVATTGKTVALCDTLIADSQYPFIWGKVKNNHASASATVKLWLYAKPRETNFITVR